jgi:hypothetical protein
MGAGARCEKQMRKGRVVKTPSPAGQGPLRSHSETRAASGVRPGLSGTCPAPIRGSFATFTGNLFCVAAQVRYHSRQVGAIPWQA